MPIGARLPRPGGRLAEGLQTGTFRALPAGIGSQRYAQLVFYLLWFDSEERFVVSSRRIAREWALKILYQIDVGKVPIAEALPAALERLRREFVQRGSRTASGSPAEEKILETVTESLTDSLSGSGRFLHRACAVFVARLLQEGAYWQERRLERAMKSLAPRLPWSPACLLAPLPETVLIPTAADPEDSLATLVTALTTSERTRFLAFAELARDRLPRLLEPEMRAVARAFAAELARDRPTDGRPEVLQDYVHTRRVQFNAANTERWSKISAMVQQQVGEWLRTAAFAALLVEGTHARLSQIDRAIATLAVDWRLDRLVAVDRSILRLGAFELLSLDQIPVTATLNEAVELAKKYSTAESGRFVNGVLAALVNSPDGRWEAADGTDELLEADTELEGAEALLETA